MFSNHKKGNKGLYEDIYISLILNIIKNYNNLKYFSRAFLLTRSIIFIRLITIEFFVYYLVNYEWSRL